MSALDNVIAGYSQRIASEEQLHEIGHAKTELDRLRDIEKSYQAWLVTDDASHIFTKVCDERDEWKRDALRVEKERDAALAACSAKDEALAEIRDFTRSELTYDEMILAIERLLDRALLRARGGQ